ncbi:MAG: sulfite exporter TauE/SafE family protein [bacterium]|nr:sulfite exporter TauE/SafE family protein [bacterium]
MISIANSFQAAFNEGQFIWTALFALSAGFLTALSPCVYPLIPVTLSIMGVRRYDTHWHGFKIALAYVSGMVLLYTILGIAFVSLGWVAGSSLQSPFVTALLAILFIAIAMSMFGAFEFEIPSAILNGVSKIRGNGYKETFIMGLFSGVIAAPCTGPVLTFILALIAKDSNYFTGTILMVLYGIGVGLPFLVLGTFSSFISKLPKSGNWLNVIKNIFGVAILSVGIYYLRFVSRPVYDLLALLGSFGQIPLFTIIILSLFLGAMKFSFKNQHNFRYYLNGLAVLLLALSLNGVADNLPNQTNVEDNWLTISSQENAYVLLQQTIKKAQAEKKPVLIDFYADWCASCKELDLYTYSDDEVKKALLRFQTIKIDASRDSADLQKIQNQFEVFGLPTIVFIDGNGHVLTKSTISGFIEAENLLEILNKIN